MNKRVKNFSQKTANASEIDRAVAWEFADQFPPKFVEKVFSAPFSPPKKRRKKRAARERNSTADQAYEMLEQPSSFSLREARRVLDDMILPPHPKLAWTKHLEGYEQARASATNAMRRIWAGTAEAHAVTQNALAARDPWLDRCLYQVRIGGIQAGSPELLRYMQHAQKIGKADWFVGQLSAELKNAKKRMPGALPFSRLRAILVVEWARSGYWLMSDDLIARVMTNANKAGPTGCIRQTITRAVKELGLRKHADTLHRPIVKDIGPGGKFVFRAGYPLKPEAVA